MSTLIVVASDGSVPSNDDITGTSGSNEIIILSSVNINIFINGEGGGDTIIIDSSAPSSNPATYVTDTVQYYATDVAYIGLPYISAQGLHYDFLVTDVVGTGQTVDLHGADLLSSFVATLTGHKPLIPFITGFSEVDLTGGGHNASTTTHTLNVDPLGIAIFSAGVTNDLTHTTGTMIVNAGQGDTINMGTGWTQAAAPVILNGIDYHDYTQLLSISTVLGTFSENITLLTEDRALIGHVATYSFQEDSTFSSNITSLVTNADHDALQFTPTFTTALGWQGTINAAGLVSINTSGSNVNAYNVAGGTVLHDSFIYHVSDNFGSTSSATITLNETVTGHAPVAVADTAATLANAPVIMNVLGNDNLGADAPALGTAGMILPTIALASSTSLDGAALSIVTVGGIQEIKYDPTSSFANLSAGMTATDTFQYKLTVPQGTSSLVTDTVTVTGVSNGPTAVNDSATTDENTAIAINVLANDSSGPLTVTAPALSADGAQLTVNPNGTISYNPDVLSATTLLALQSGQSAVDTFSYTITNPLGLSASALVSVTVNGLGQTIIGTPTSNTANIADGSDIFFSGSGGQGTISYTAVSAPVTAHLSSAGVLSSTPTTIVDAVGVQTLSFNPVVSNSIFLDGGGSYVINGGINDTITDTANLVQYALTQALVGTHIVNQATLTSATNGLTLAKYTAGASGVTTLNANPVDSTTFSLNGGGSYVINGGINDTITDTANLVQYALTQAIVGTHIVNQATLTSATNGLTLAKYTAGASGVTTLNANPVDSTTFSLNGGGSYVINGGINDTITDTANLVQYALTQAIVGTHIVNQATLTSATNGLTLAKYTAGASGVTTLNANPVDSTTFSLNGGGSYVINGGINDTITDTANLVQYALTQAIVGTHIVNQATLTSATNGLTLAKYTAGASGVTTLNANPVDSTTFSLNGGGSYVINGGINDTITDTANLVQYALTQAIVGTHIVNQATLTSATNGLTLAKYTAGASGVTTLNANPVDSTTFSLNGGGSYVINGGINDTITDTANLVQYALTQAIVGTHIVNQATLTSATNGLTLAKYTAGASGVTTLNANPVDSTTFSLNGGGSYVINGGIHDTITDTANALSYALTEVLVGTSIVNQATLTSVATALTLANYTAGASGVTTINANPVDSSTFSIDDNGIYAVTGGIHDTIINTASNNGALYHLSSLGFNHLVAINTSLGTTPLTYTAGASGSTTLDTHASFSSTFFLDGGGSFIVQGGSYDTITDTANLVEYALTQALVGTQIVNQATLTSIASGLTLLNYTASSNGTTTINANPVDSTTFSLNGGGDYNIQGGINDTIINTANTLSYSLFLSGSVDQIQATNFFTDGQLLNYTAGSPGVTTLDANPTAADYIYVDSGSWIISGSAQDTVDFANVTGPVTLSHDGSGNTVLTGVGLNVTLEGNINLIDVTPFDYLSVSAADTHSLSIDSSGHVWAWGANGSGQLGNNTTTNSAVPVEVLGAGGSGLLSNIVQVAVGQNDSFALDNSGHVWAWGDSSFGQLGDNGANASISTPLEVLGPGGVGFLSNIEQIAAGTNDGFALNTSGHVWAWGDNAVGALGINSGAGSVSTPSEVVGAEGIGFLSNITQIAAQHSDAIALDTSGHVWDWGDNTFGQLGNNSALTTSSAPVEVHGSGNVGFLANIVEVSEGNANALALGTSGHVWAWGINSAGQLGNNTTIGSSTPVEVDGSGGVGFLSNISEISSGASHSLALDTSGHVWAWGSGISGDLGQNSLANSATPVEVQGAGGAGFLSNIIEISAGNAFSLAMDNSGHVWAWGDNGSNELGNGTTANSLTPVQITGTTVSTGINLVNLIGESGSVGVGPSNVPNINEVLDFTHPSQDFLTLRVNVAADNILDPGHTGNISTAALNSVATFTHPVAGNTQIAFTGGGEITLTGVTDNTFADFQPGHLHVTLAG